MPEFWGWGDNNNYGQLGDSTTDGKNSPISVTGDMSNAWIPSSGNGFTIGLLEDGTAWAWGHNSHGQLGDLTTISRSSPVSVVGGFTDWSFVYCGSDHTNGIREDGSLWAWGSNYNDRFGNGSSIDQSSPIRVFPEYNDWVRCKPSRHRSSGITDTHHTLALRSNGELWAWGTNYYGQLGDGTQSNIISSPTKIQVGGSDWAYIATGFTSSMAIKEDGTLWAWGANEYGQLGDSTTYNRSSPIQIGENWSFISSGHLSSFGIMNDGTLWSWGLNYDGQLGDGTSGYGFDRSSPVSVLGGFTDWIKVSSANRRSVGVRSNGTLWAWGWGGFIPALRATHRTLGTGDIESRSSPTLVLGGFADWIDISVGRNHAMGVRDPIPSKDFYPLVCDFVESQIMELRSTDNMNMEGCSIVNANSINGIALTSTSDENKKDRIQRIEDPISTIKKMNGVSFRWKSSGKRSIGLIAQEIEDILPSVVSNRSSNRSISYGNIVGLLIEAVKSQSSRIAKLKEKA